MFCLNCGKDIPPDHKNFCSYTCFQEYSKRTRRIYTKCLVCGKEIFMKKSEAKKRKQVFCSIDCRSKYGRVEHACEFCNKKYRTFRSYVKDGRKYCSKRCMSEHRKIIYLGSLNPHFKSGQSTIYKQMRRLARYTKWRKDILKRDKYTCQDCKKIFEKKFLDVHHIKRLWQLFKEYPNKNINFNDEYFYDLNNGITLCKDCHRKTFKKDEDNIE